MNNVHTESSTMFKTMITLMRGQAAAAGESLADRNALAILDQQMRDTRVSLASLQRALATALAEEAQEARRHQAVLARIAELETRTRAAITAGHNALANEAAEAIAGLEQERDAGAGARASFAAEIARLRRAVATTGQRVAALERGRRAARVAEAVRVARQGRMEPAPQDRATLAEAEATLSRLRQQQTHAAAADGFLEEIAEPASLDDRMAAAAAAAGAGPATRPTAASVRARLRTI